MRLSRPKGGKAPKSVAMEIAFWRHRDVIHIASNDRETKTFHVAVRDDPSKPSGHPYLYRELKKCLEQKGVWDS